MAAAAQARPRGPPSGCASFLLLLPLLLLLRVGPTEASELLLPVPESGICKSVDVRNRLESFKQLDGCQVIEGYLQILLFDNVNETELAKISFPELTEITDYFLLFRVNGLRSLGQLFPNLAVIRGKNLFPGSKSLVIFEMSSLQELGLHSLTDIMRGTVYVDKNPSLCFVYTIDWGTIIHDKTLSTPYLKSLKPENECPVCPESVNGKACPRNPYDKENKYLCWNREHCQKTCLGDCNTCNQKDECCDQNCIGGCDTNDSTKCTLCRHYSLSVKPNDIPKCVEKCPLNYYRYLDRRCVSKDECLNMSRPIELHESPNEDIEHPYKIFNDSCVLECPPNFSDNYTTHTCEKCDSTCRKECPGARIDSINLAKQLRGCTHITSSLEIQIRGGNNVVKELEDNLGMIEEIDGYLKVVRSFSLVSLNFFKNLKRIRGKFLDSQRYSLVVLDNQNLLDLWDWSNNRKFQIDNGTLFFHFNPKLCISKIEKLRQVADLAHFTELEVASNSNGDKVACNVTELMVNITSIASKAVILEWPRFDIDDPRKLLSYTVYCIEAPNKSVNFYDGRDACGQDNWHVDDVANLENNPVQHILTNLKPFTQYAFYVRTYTIATEKYGAQSKLNYFTTKPAQPSAPTQLMVASNSSDSLSIKWGPPQSQNGKISHYIVSGTKHETLHDSNHKNRDYCKDTVSPTAKQETTYFPSAIPRPKNDTCESTKKEGPVFYDEQEEIARINFENELHNKVYVKRPKDTHVRTRRTLEFIDRNSGNMSQSNKVPFYTFPLLEPNSSELVYDNKTEDGTNIWESFNFPVYGKTDFYIKNLHHYTSYDIQVKACREKVKEDNESDCSVTTSDTSTTMKKVGADKITNVTILNTTIDSVTVRWTQPRDPNGMVVSVTILYKREGSKNAQYIAECVSFQDFKNFSVDNRNMTYTISKLFPGNHSLCLRASSFAGDGDISDCVNFLIPEKTSSVVLIVSLVLFTLFCVVVGVLWWLYRKNVKERENMRLIPAVNPEYVHSVYVADEWEVPRKNIELIKELGQGSFGMVWEGIAHDIKGQPSIRCAVKTVNEHATNRERVEFLNEASVMKAFDTTHVVRLLGVVSEGQPTLVIMELMANGDLKSYLRSHRPDVETFDPTSNKQPPSLKQILQMAVEIADGMAYLEAKKFVHRDLAARNCMVSEDLVVKIGDFGMTRDIYETDYYRKGTKGLLPVRWMAPESLKDGVFTSSSDVWSYGIVLWEMATLASQPYQGLSNDQVLRYVIDGGVMERPENCPDKLYTLMRYCWQSKPVTRPSFIKLCQLLLDDASEAFPRVSFYHSAAGKEAQAARVLASPGYDEADLEGDGDDTDVSTPLRRPPASRRGYVPSESQESDEIDIDTHHQFPSISEEPTANGYVGGRAKNGTTQSTQS